MVSDFLKNKKDNSNFEFFAASQIATNDTLCSSDKINELYLYWKSKKIKNKIPSRSQLDPCEFHHLLPYIMLIDVVNDASDFIYRIFGTALVDRFGGDPTGYALTQVIDFLDLNEYGEKLKMDYIKLVKIKKPLYRSHDLSMFNKPHIKYQSLLLPLSDDGSTVNKIISMIQFN